MRSPRAGSAVAACSCKAWHCCVPLVTRVPGPLLLCCLQHRCWLARCAGHAQPARLCGCPLSRPTALMPTTSMPPPSEGPANLLLATAAAPGQPAAQAVLEASEGAEAHAHPVLEAAQDYRGAVDAFLQSSCRQWLHQLLGCDLPPDAPVAQLLASGRLLCALPQPVANPGCAAVRAAAVPPPTPLLAGCSVPLTGRPVLHRAGRAWRRRSRRARQACPRPRWCAYALRTALRAQGVTLAVLERCPCEQALAADDFGPRRAAAVYGDVSRFLEVRRHICAHFGCCCIGSGLAHCCLDTPVLSPSSAGPRPATN